MNKETLLITILTGVSFFANAQKEDTLTISPIVGNVIDSAEKIEYKIFPYYSSQMFVRAVFISHADSSITLNALLKPDSVDERPMTKQEYDWIFNMIEVGHGTEISQVPNPNSKIYGNDRKWSFSLFGGFSIMGPGKDIDNQMKESGLDDTKPGSNSFFKTSSKSYPVRKTGMVWNFETGYFLSKKSAINFTAGKINHTSVQGFGEIINHDMEIKSDLLSASLNYIWRIGKGNNGLWLGPVIARHKIRVEDTYRYFDQYYYDILTTNSSTSSTITAGFNLGCTLAFVQKKSWFLAFKASYTWLPDTEIGPFTSQITSGSKVYTYVFEEIRISMSTINIGVATGWRF